MSDKRLEALIDGLKSGIKQQKNSFDIAIALNKLAAINKSNYEDWFNAECTTLSRGHSMHCLQEWSKKIVSLAMTQTEILHDKLTAAQMPGAPPDQIKKIACAANLAELIKCVSHLREAQELIGEVNLPLQSHIRAFIAKQSVLNPIILLGLPESTTPDEAATLAEACAVCRFGNAAVFEHLISMMRDQSLQKTSYPTGLMIKNIDVALRIDCPEIYFALSESAKEYLEYVRNVEMGEIMGPILTEFNAGLSVVKSAQDSLKEYPAIWEQSQSTVELKDILKDEFNAPVASCWLGPYFLPIADSAKRTAWLVCDRKSVSRMRMKRHLEGFGWSIREFQHQNWPCERDAKIDLVRNDLIMAGLLVI